MATTTTNKICTLALLLAFALAPSVSMAGRGSDAREAKEDVEAAKEAADKAKKVKGADADDLKGAGKNRAKEEANDAAKDAIRESAR